MLHGLFYFSLKLLFEFIAGNSVLVFKAFVRLTGIVDRLDGFLIWIWTCGVNALVVFVGVFVRLCCGC